ncbi:hypothetical protein BE11_15320 [Sorangium cellulosum]|nr:hypothetical protein BE11_15320 [Sorangium cellulosum]
MKKVMQCANGGLDLDVYTWEIAKGKAKGCISSEAELDSEIKQQLIKVVDDAEGSGVDSWKLCYGNQITTVSPGK